MAVLCAGGFIVAEESFDSELREQMLSGAEMRSFEKCFERFDCFTKDELKFLKRFNAFQEKVQSRLGRLELDDEKTDSDTALAILRSVRKSYKKKNLLLLLIEILAIFCLIILKSLLEISLSSYKKQKIQKKLKIF